MTLVQIPLSKSQQLFSLPTNLEDCKPGIDDLRVSYTLQHLILPSRNTYAEGIMKKETEVMRKQRDAQPPSVIPAFEE